MNPWPGPSVEMCRGILLYRFWRILPEIFLEDFSGRLFPPKNEEKKSGDKIREELRRPKNKNPQKNPFCQNPALRIPLEVFRESANRAFVIVLYSTQFLRL